MSVFSVSTLVHSIRYSFSQHPVLRNRIQVEGEISGFKVYGPHAYFSLKDEHALIKCVYFGVTQQVRDQANDGIRVLLGGRIDIYTQKGDLQFYADSFDVLSREGYLLIQFLHLKDRLVSEGIIPRKEEQKRPFPKYPHRIGLVASRGSAALQDMLTVFQNRYPFAELCLFHTSVQGNTAKDEIAHAIETAQSKGVDLIIVARGGGALEDLWPFNEEKVVRAVRSSQVPIVTGVGHQTDNMLVDFAADYSAATPTAAAVFAVPDAHQQVYHSFLSIERSAKEITTQWARKRQSLRILRGKIRIHRPDLRLQRQRLKAERLRETMKDCVRLTWARSIQRTNNWKNRLQKNTPIYSITISKTRLQGYKEAFDSLHPLRTVQRGFAWVEKDGAIISESKSLKPKDPIRIVMRDGQVISIVEKVIGKGEENA